MATIKTFEIRVTVGEDGKLEEHEDQKIEVNSEALDINPSNQLKILTEVNQFNHHELQVVSRVTPKGKTTTIKRKLITE